MKKYIVVILALLGLSLTAGAQELFSYKDSVKTGYPFLLCLPDGYNPVDTSAKKPPLIVFLHGKSRTGRDLNMITKYGCIDALRRGQNIPAIIVSPQTSVPSWDASKVMNIVDWVGERFPYDTTRLYVIGMSMGGWGTFKVVANYPERVTAAIAECGGFTEDNIEGLTKVPLWIIHGTSDKITRPSFSKSIVSRMEEIDGGTERLHTTWLEGCNHSILARTFLLCQIYDWLFAHNLTDPDRPVCTGIDITPSDLNNAYMRLDPANARQLPIKKP